MGGDARRTGQAPEQQGEQQGGRRAVLPVDELEDLALRRRRLLLRGLDAAASPTQASVRSAAAPHAPRGRA